MITTHTIHRPPPVSFNMESVVHALRFAAAYEPQYVQRQARAMLTRILGPGWRAWPTSRPAQAPLSPQQRKQFHLHPVPTGIVAPDPAVTIIQDDDRLEDDDDYW
jgi:hypothetical protein